MTEPEVRSRGRGERRRVYVEADGREASHLDHGPFVFPVGRDAAVRMAGVGGVGTQPEFRRRGFARRIFARAMEEIRQAGYSCAGLYTSTDVIAHRLYRRFGFVDIVVHRPAVKLLDASAFVSRRLTRAISAAAERDQTIAEWTCCLTIALPDEPPMSFRIEAAGVHVPDMRPGRSDLTLTTCRSVLLRMCYGTMSPGFSEAGGLLRWHGDAEHWRRLSAVIAAQNPVINEGTL